MSGPINVSAAMPEAWSRAWMEMGGTLTVVGDGSLLLGAPQTSFWYRWAGLPKQAGDTPPHLVLRNLDEWNGAFRALELVFHLAEKAARAERNDPVEGAVT